MNRLLTMLAAAVAAIAVASAQSVPDMGEILRATERAAAEANAGTAEVLDGVAASMRQQQSSMSQTIGGVAAAMRAAGSSSGSDNNASATGDFASAGITYSTYGIDARQDIARPATGSGHVNPFVMGTYSPATTYAAPGGSRYINTGYGTSKAAPVSGSLVSGFGYRPAFGRMHYGVDLQLNTGDTVRAAFEGKVVLVSNDPDGYGRYVKVKHAGGMETIYGHLSYPLVVHGQYLRAGQPLGIGGSTGNATGPHLHFETRIAGVAVDPANYFDFDSNGNAKPRSGGKAGSKKERSSQHKKQTKPSPPRVAGLKTETVASAASATAKPRTATYRVRRGDTIEKIAREHGMSVGELCRINKMSKYTPMYNGKVIRLK